MTQFFTMFYNGVQSLFDSICTIQVWGVNFLSIVCFVFVLNCLYRFVISPLFSHSVGLGSVRSDSPPEVNVDRAKEYPKGYSNGKPWLH